MASLQRNAFQTLDYLPVPTLAQQRSQTQESTPSFDWPGFDTLTDDLGTVYVICTQDPTDSRVAVFGARFHQLNWLQGKIYHDYPEKAIKMRWGIPRGGKPWVEGRNPRDTAGTELEE